MVAGGAHVWVGAECRMYRYTGSSVKLVTPFIDVLLGF